MISLKFLQSLKFLGHSDSWDLGQGSLDDGIGPILAIEVVNLFRFLNLNPRRTIRNAFFTGEEAGLFGARRYVSDHRSDLDSYSAALEADFGCLRASGLLFSGSPKATCIIHEIMQLYSQMTNATSLIKVGAVPTDIYLMNRGGVPGIVLNGDDGRYFWYAQFFIKNEKDLWYFSEFFILFNLKVSSYKCGYNDSNGPIRTG